MVRAKTSPARAPRSESRWVALLGLVLAAAIATVLVVMATTRPEPVSSTATPIPIPELTETPTATAPPAPLPDLGHLARYLVPLDDTTAWRTGDAWCEPGEIATVEVTDDAGASWESYSFAQLDSAAVPALDPSTLDRSILWAVTASTDDCELGYAASYTGGEFWRFEDETPSVPFVDADGVTIVDGNARLAAPCTIAGFGLQGSTQASVVCSDGQVRVTADSAVTWQSPSLDVVALAITRSASGYLIAASRAEGCGGVQLIEVRAADAGVTPGICFAGLAETTPLALALAGDTVWVWAGDAVAVSANGVTGWPAGWLDAAPAEPAPAATPAPTEEPTDE